MNPVTMRRIAIAGAILAILVAIDGLFMIITNYKPDDSSSNIFHLSDGGTVLLASALLVIIAIVAFVLSNRTHSAATESIAKSEVEPEVKG
ncbi:MAG: hypothetical protein JOZ18_01135 [Chloroflexi bacterium]|nr:hypothetical protein [Chloroflexota bacterium]